MACECDPGTMQRLLEVTEKNALTTDKLVVQQEISNRYNRDVTRWLLAVVCIIALGNRLMETVKDVWGAKAVMAEGK